MTKEEMLKQEAEEYAERTKTEKEIEVLNTVHDWGQESLSPNERRLFEGIQDRKEAREQGFKDGAEFGYNKANEWHYVKDEFPPENVPLNIITLDKNKKRRLWVGEYKGGNGEYWSGYFNHFIDVPYAWKEIVLPKESE